MISDCIGTLDSCSSKGLSTSGEGVTCSEALQITKSLQSTEYMEQILDDGENGEHVLGFFMSQQDAGFFTNCKSRMQGADSGHNAAKVDLSNHRLAADKAHL